MSFLLFWLRFFHRLVLRSTLSPPSTGTTPWTWPTLCTALTTLPLSTMKLRKKSRSTSKLHNIKHISLLRNFGWHCTKITYTWPGKEWSSLTTLWWWDGKPRPPWFRLRAGTQQTQLFRFHDVQYYFLFFLSSHFGFFAPGEIDVVQSLQETELYQEDFIGDFHKTLSVILTFSLIFSCPFLAILSFPTHLETIQFSLT